MRFLASDSVQTLFFQQQHQSVKTNFRDVGHRVDQSVNNVDEELVLNECQQRALMKPMHKKLTAALEEGSKLVDDVKEAKNLSMALQAAAKEGAMPFPLFAVSISLFINNKRRERVYREFW
eukprot:GEMP01081654.1.p1 GENE.GEMP01081654.1~~GEMP01081654.1.p1  ORF type:complete len:121 (+),score=30.52 GEMP01081654.1:134-496(+)